MKYLQGILDWCSLGKIWFFSVLMLLILFGMSRLLISAYMIPNWDNAILIDGSYRVFLGQKPHHDFSTPIGPIYFAIGALGMLLTSPTIAGIDFGIVVFGIALLGICSYVFRGMSKGSMGLFLLVLGSYLFTGRMLHADNPAAGGYTGLYNLYGYSLFFIASTYLYVFDNHHGQKPAKTEKIDGIFIAFLLILALFIKNIFGICMIVLISIFRFKSSQKKFYISFFLAVASYSFLIFAWLNFDIQSIIRDQVFVISSRLAGGGILWNPEAIWRFLQATWIDNLYILAITLFSRKLLSRAHWVKLIKLSIFWIFNLLGHHAKTSTCVICFFCLYDSLSVV